MKKRSVFFQLVAFAVLGIVLPIFGLFSGCGFSTSESSICSKLSEISCRSRDNISLLSIDSHEEELFVSNIKDDYESFADLFVKRIYSTRQIVSQHSYFFFPNANEKSALDLSPVFGDERTGLIYSYYLDSYTSFLGFKTNYSTQRLWRLRNEYTNYFFVSEEDAKEILNIENPTVADYDSLLDREWTVECQGESMTVKLGGVFGGEAAERMKEIHGHFVLIPQGFACKLKYSSLFVECCGSDAANRLARKSVTQFKFDKGRISHFQLIDKADYSVVDFSPWYRQVVSGPSVLERSLSISCAILAVAGCIAYFFWAKTKAFRFASSRQSLLFAFAVLLIQIGPAYCFLFLIPRVLAFSGTMLTTRLLPGVVLTFLVIGVLFLFNIVLFRRTANESLSAKETPKKGF